jgi:NADH-quinone oxidoreductase subunit J
VSGAVATGAIGFVVARAASAPEVVVDRGGAGMIDAAVEQWNVVGAIAHPMFRDYVVAFEVTGVILLVAVVGAVLLAKRRV